jgi:glycosyltransferase involved in cell wall biosynthesis
VSNVAVLTTCFNEEAWIEDAIRSVLAQTVPAREHVVVNDGSTDGSQAVIDHYPHVRSLQITNRGLPAARNAGLLALAPEVEWVIFLDGDDWLEPNFIEECLLAQSESGSEIVFPGRVRHPGGPRVYMPDVLNPTEEDLWQKCHGTSCAFVSRRLLVEAGGFHPATGGDCDWDFWIDAVRRGVRFAYAPRTHYNYRIRPDSMSRVSGERLRPVHLREMRRHHGVEVGPEAKLDALSLALAEEDEVIRRSALR